MSGTYEYSLGGGSFPDWFALDYPFHNKKVQVMGDLNVTNPGHMEMTNIYSWKNGESYIGSDYRVATGLHLHQGDIIYLTVSSASQDFSPYSIGFAAGKRDALKNVYDSTSACNAYNTINNTAAQAYACLKGYSDGDTSRYHAGYLQGVQGAELKGTHTQEFIKGYFKGIQGYWSNRGLAEGYSGLSMSSHKGSGIQIGTCRICSRIPNCEKLRNRPW